MADRASSPPPPPGSPPATPPSVKRLRDAARGVSEASDGAPYAPNVDAQLDELRRTPGSEARPQGQAARHVVIPRFP